MYKYIYALKFEGGPWDAQEALAGDTYIYVCLMYVKHIDRLCLIYVKHIDRYIYKHTYVYTYMYIHIYALKSEDGPWDAQEASSGDT